ncbi:ATP-binding protein [Streptomyces mangrovisoli]|uniref:LuxR family transcriptional regulator n=1 Tax=Streptomyces mangrovisoli TaxID=1428628 RepID=A0A1J4NYI1_9ACTN|nr:helix-turn-helix transcriptional regulator [Streptomyces mangrovisoli]OIJ66540.1 LuxR family transcriptional regulator [Streptomyces mangrovisoli]
MSQVSLTSPLVGRDDEVALLAGVLRRVRDGEARAVLVAGDAGVGKSRLLGELAERASRGGATVLTGHCVDLGDVGLPYLPFTEILGVLAADERFAKLCAAHPAAGRLLGAGAGTEPVRDGDGRLRLFEAVAGLLADVAAVTPLLLVIEDLHWADQSSRDLLRFLLSRGVLQRPAGGGPAHRLALFASYRADDLHRRHPLRPLLAELVRLPAVERLELRPLPDPEVARLVRSLRQGPLPEATVRRIVERAEGNAFYAEELLAATDAEAGGVPSGLADVLLIRFEQLTDTAQQVLRTAAVAGRRVEHDLLRAAVGLPEDELETALREAVGRRLLVPGDGDTYAFRHALAREAVYADLLPGERSRLHGTFARLLADHGGRPENAAERAHHYRESHDLPEALAASLEAAGHAQRVGAPAEELRHLEAALDLWTSVDPAARPAGEGAGRVALMLRASAAAAHTGLPHRAVSLTRAALAGTGRDTDAELAARVRYTLAGNLIGVDSLKAAFAYSSEALAMIPAEPPSRTWLWAAATHVLAARQVGEDATALRVAREALGVAERLGVLDAQADLLISLAGLEGGGRRTPAGRARLHEARELAHRAGNAPVELRALYNLAVGWFESGELTECLPWLTEGLDRARRAGLASSPYPMEMRYVRLLALYTLGRWDECVRTAAEDAEALPLAVGYTVGPALCVALARGDEAAAEQRAQALLQGPFDWMATMVAGIVLTDAAALRGDAEAAVARTRTTVEALTDESGRRPDLSIRLAALALSAVADRAGDLRLAGDTAGVAEWTARATELVELARATAGRDGGGRPQGPEGLAWLARAEAEWTRAVSGTDAAAWEKAVQSFDYGDGYEQARCRLRFAEALLTADRKAEAAAQARETREAAARLGAIRLLARVDALIRRGRLGDTAAADRSGPVLTAREQEVLRLLALGRSNRRIGEELYISGKTASVHVSNILAKLGAAGRTEAVAIAYREGLIPYREGPATPEPAPGD